MPYGQIDDQASRLTWKRYEITFWQIAKAAMVGLAIAAGIKVIAGGAILAAIATVGGVAAHFQQQKTEEEYNILSRAVHAKNDARYFAEEMGQVYEKEREQVVEQQLTPEEKQRMSPSRQRQAERLGVTTLSHAVGDDGYQQNVRDDGKSWDTVLQANQAAQEESLTNNEHSR